MRIAIIPTGWDKEIIVRSAYKSSADLVILIIPAVETITQNVNQNTLRVARLARKEIDKFTKTEFFETSYVDYYKAFKDLMGIVKTKKNEGNDLHINISPGNKIIASVLLTVAFLNQLNAYYSVPEEYNEAFLAIDKPYRKGLLKLVEIPALPINIKLSKKERELLELITKCGTIGVADYLKNFEHKNENKARAQFHYYINKFKSLGLTKINSNDGKFEVSLTKSGKLISGVI